MAGFLSAEWVAEFNDALAGQAVTPAEPTSVSAESGNFIVGQVVRDAPVEVSPTGEVRTNLVVADHVLQLELVDPDAPADVTIVLTWADTVALSKGELDVAEALGQGKVRVRGDLSVLVAGQAAIAAASPLLAGVAARTTY